MHYILIYIYFMDIFKFSNDIGKNPMSLKKVSNSNKKPYLIIYIFNLFRN